MQHEHDDFDYANLLPQGDPLRRIAEERPLRMRAMQQALGLDEAAVIEVALDALYLAMQDGGRFRAQGDFGPWAGGSGAALDGGAHDGRPRP